MRRMPVMWLSAFLLAAGVVIPGPHSFAYASRAAAPADLSASYVLHQDLSGNGYVRSLMTLLQNDTGYSDLDTIVWSRDGRQITLVFTSRQDPSDQTTYVGTLLSPRVNCSPRRISSQRQPGTISGSQGEAGTFYALNKTQTTCKPGATR